MKLIQKSHLSTLLFILIFLITPLLHSAETLDPNTGIQLAFLSAVLFIFGIYLFVKKKPISINFNKIGSVLILLTILFLFKIVNATLSITPSDAVFEIIKFTLFLVLLFVITLYFKPEIHFLTISRILTFLCIIISIKAYTQILELSDKQNLIIPESTYNIYSFFGHRNIFSQILYLTIPFSVFSIIKSNGIYRIMGYISLTNAVYLITLLSNRGVWLASTIVAFATLFVIAIHVKKNIFTKNNFIIASIIVISLFLSISTLNHFSDKKSLEEHTTSITNFDKGSVKDRMELWKRTISLVKEKPLTGYGLASWKIHMLKYGNKGLASENNTTFYQRPHNDFLWILSEQGIIGFILILSIIFLILYKTAQTIILDPKEETNNHFYVLLFVLAGYFIFSLISFPRERITHNILFTFALGVMLNKINSGNDNPNHIKLSKYYHLIPILTLAFLFISGIIRINSEKHTRKAIEYKTRGKHNKCISEIEKAKSFLYKTDATSMPLDWYVGLSYYNLKNYSKAQLHFESAYKLNPYNIYILNDLGSCYSQTGNIEKAIETYNIGMIIADNFENINLNLCAIYFKQKEYNLAFHTLKKLSKHSNSDRYKKSVYLVTKNIIAQEIILGTNSDFSVLYNKHKDNIKFYISIFNICKSEEKEISIVINDKIIVEKIYKDINQNQEL